MFQESIMCKRKLFGLYLWKAVTTIIVVIPVLRERKRIILYFDESTVEITGTLIWFYKICGREVWLMAHSIIPDQQDDNIDIGRFLHENTYQRNKKEIVFGNKRVASMRKGSCYIRKRRRGSMLFLRKIWKEN